MRSVITASLDATLLRGVVRRRVLAEELALLRNEIQHLAAAAEDRAKRVAREHTEASSSAVFEAVISASRDHTEAAVEAAIRAVVESMHCHIDEALAAAVEMMEERRKNSTSDLAEELRGFVEDLVAELRRTIRHVEAAQTFRPTNPHDSGALVAPSWLEISPSLYAEIEDRFRGSEDVIAQRQSAYLPDINELLASDETSILDIGSGRGEWLSTVQTAYPNITVRGVDSNAVFVEESAARGLDVVHADALEHLRDLSDEELDVVTMFHVAEHLPVQVLSDMCVHIARVLRPGGKFICETPNCSSLSVGASTFWIDPTHPRPLHPEVLRFLVHRAGFAQTEMRYLHKVTPPSLADIDATVDPGLAGVVDAVWGHGDVAVIGHR